MVKWNQGFPNNRNSLLGHQVKPGGATGPPTHHRERQAEGRPKKKLYFIYFLFLTPKPFPTTWNNLSKSKQVYFSL
jgi:hypothetical protein